MLFSRLLDIVRIDALARLPSLCAVCHGWGAQRVCARCLQRYGAALPRCHRCALPSARWQRRLRRVPDRPATLRAHDRRGRLRPPVGRPDHAVQVPRHARPTPALAAQMLAALRRGAATAPTPLLPIPLSDARLRERGYNRAWELARRLGRALRCPTDARLLLRVRDTPHQLAFPPEQRAGNVRAAFAVEPRRRAELQGRSVTLVDDVMTTGATVAEAARTLLRAGASEVGVWVIARTPRHDDA